LREAVCSASRNLICERYTKPVTGARAFVWLPLKSGTTYLTLYDQATPLRHLKGTLKLIFNQAFTS